MISTILEVYVKLELDVLILFLDRVEVTYSCSEKVLQTGKGLLNNVESYYG